MKDPLVSIIIPTYNRAHLIGETLDSVLAQTYTNWECIVVDDGSTDTTAELMEAYCNKDARFQYHHRPKDRLPGGNAARNYGFELSKGEYVNWFDSDDIMHSSKISIQIKSLLDSDFKFSICQTLNYKETIEDVYGLRPDTRFIVDPFDEYVKEEFVVFTPSTLWKKSLLNEKGYRFNESLKASQEWEFYSNVFFYEKNFEFVKIPLVYIRFHDKRITTTNANQKFHHYYIARFIIYKKYQKKLSNEIEKYFINYFISIYKLLLKRHAYKFSLNIFFVLFTSKALSLKKKFFLTFSFFSFVSLKRGDFLIRQVKL